MKMRPRRCSASDCSVELPALRKHGEQSPSKASSIVPDVGVGVEVATLNGLAARFEELHGLPGVRRLPAPLVATAETASALEWRYGSIKLVPKSRRSGCNCRTVLRREADTVRDRDRVCIAKIIFGDWA